MTVKCDHAGIAVVVTVMTVGHVYFWFYHDPFLSALYSTLISVVGFYVAVTIVGNSGLATNAILFCCLFTIWDHRKSVVFAFRMEGQGQP